MVWNKRPTPSFSGVHGDLVYPGVGPVMAAPPIREHKHVQELEVFLSFLYVLAMETAALWGLDARAQVDVVLGINHD